MADDNAGAVVTERHEHVLVIRLNRPDRRNAVNGDIAKGLEAAIDELEGDEALWVGVLTGNGPVFCAGADLKMMAEGRAMELITARGDFGGFVRRERTKPVIAALNGDAFAGGFEIAIAADLIVAAEGARVGIPETKRCLLAAAGGMARLPRLVGEKLALEMAITAAPQPVERFVPTGLVSRVVPADEVLTAAFELAEQICENAPLAVQAARRVVVECRDLDEDASWKRVMKEMPALYQSEDFQEGPRSFLEKRKPVWKGR